MICTWSNANTNYKVELLTDSLNNFALENICRMDQQKYIDNNPKKRLKS